MQNNVFFIMLTMCVWTAVLISCNNSAPNETQDSDTAEALVADTLADTLALDRDDGSRDSDETDSRGVDSESLTGETTTGWSTDSNGTVVITDGGELATDGDGNQFVCHETRCDGRILECGDCKDNDGDGHTDWRDRECLGPCDNTEGPALISDVGGVTGSTCHVDCYFDYGNGMGTGSDDCWWSHECDPLEPEATICEYRESLVDNQKFCPTEQSDRCTSVCLPFTPNGCDCFGCCTFPELSGKGENGIDAYVWIGAKDETNAGMCTFDDILDESKCPRCTPVGNCLNKCGHCEICIGKPELPDDCKSVDTDDNSTDEIDSDDTDRAPPSTQCPDGVTPCSVADTVPCDKGYYCISGCCQPTIIVE